MLNHLLNKMKFINLVLSVTCILFSPADSIGSGDYIPINEAPFYVSIGSDFSVFCGGTIISNHWVLTAAHCVNYNHRTSRVIAGKSVNVYYKGITHEIEKIFVYGDFAPAHFLLAHDIALLKLKTPITFNEQQQPVRISSNLPKDGAQLLAYGIGYENDHNKYASVLKKTQLSVSNKNDCENMVEDNETVPLAKSMFCAISNSSQVCPGDSGGPAIVDGKLVGIVQWDSGNCRGWSHRNESLVVGFTRVDIHYEWIIKLTGIQY